MRVDLLSLRRLAPKGRDDILVGVASAFDGIAAAHHVDTPLRVCHFLAQAAHETDGFRTLQEYGGPQYFARYDGRRDLGNMEAGDGARFHGRGIFQLTGRTNYRTTGDRLGLDLISHPDLASEPSNSLRIAMDYWSVRHINLLADADDIGAVTRKINGGLNGIEDRRGLLGIAKGIYA